MTADDKQTQPINDLLATPDLAGALESEQFRRFLDQVPIAIIVSDMTGRERIVYANPEFEKLSGLDAALLVGKPWKALDALVEKDSGGGLGDAIIASIDFLGTFRINRGENSPLLVGAYANIIEAADETPAYRLAALVDVTAHEQDQREEYEQRIREKETLLLEVQHRVKNNLQMITALIRIEARNARGIMDPAPFDRLAGRIEAIQILYASLVDHGQGDEIDLGSYLSQIASSVLRSHGVEGITLDLKVDSYPVSVNVAMPTGLVVNELLTNALKHAFVGRDGGTISLHSLSDGNGCRITIADDGIGLPEGTQWPRHGKLGSLIVQSLRENAMAELEVESQPGQGMRVTIIFRRANVVPDGSH